MALPASSACLLASGVAHQLQSKHGSAAPVICLQLQHDALWALVSMLPTPICHCHCMHLCLTLELGMFAQEGSPRIATCSICIWGIYRVYGSGWGRA